MERLGRIHVHGLSALTSILTAFFVFRTWQIEVPTGPFKIFNWLGTDFCGEGKFQFRHRLLFWHRIPLPNFSSPAFTGVMMARSAVRLAQLGISYFRWVAHVTSESWGGKILFSEFFLARFYIGFPKSHGREC